MYERANMEPKIIFTTLLPKFQPSYSRRYSITWNLVKETANKSCDLNRPSVAMASALAEHTDSVALC